MRGHSPYAFERPISGHLAFIFDCFVLDLSSCFTTLYEDKCVESIAFHPTPWASHSVKIAPSRDAQLRPMPLPSVAKTIIADLYLLAASVPSVLLPDAPSTAPCPTPRRHRGGQRYPRLCLFRDLRRARRGLLRCVRAASPTQLILN